MIFAIWFASLVDLLLTAWGLSLGVIKEANPIMASIFDASPALAVVLGIVGTTAGLLVLKKARKNVWWVDHALFGLLSLRVVVLGMHAIWVTTLVI